MAHPRPYDAWGSRVAAAPCATGFHMTLRGCYRTDHQKQRIKTTINVIASFRSGAATMVRMPCYVG